MIVELILCILSPIKKPEKSKHNSGYEESAQRIFLIQ